MTRRSIPIWWTLPAVLWGALIVIGLIAAPVFCKGPTLHLVGAVFLVFAAGVVARAANSADSEPEDTTAPLMERIALGLGVLFTAGIAVAWAMAALGPCL